MQSSTWRVNLIPIVFVPLDQQSENESSGSNHFRDCSDCAVKPRALVFRPLVKGNEDSGNETDCDHASEQVTSIAHVTGTRSRFLSFPQVKMNKCFITRVSTG